MSFQAYVTYLVNQFKKENKKQFTLDYVENISHQWLGLLPFLWKWISLKQKKNVPSDE